MNIFYTPDINQELYTLSEDESKHALRVLRLKAGDDVILADGKGNWYECNILEDHPKRCTVQVKNKKYVQPRNFNLHIAIAPTKSPDRFEWFLEKATEIGIEEITPLICDHSERRELKIERFDKIITSAVKQSLKAYHPKLNPAIEFKKFIKEGLGGKGYIAHCREDSTKKHLGLMPLKKENTLVLIGPEGDFSEREIQQALDNKYEAISLGSSRLRTETAAVVACNIVNLLNEIQE